MVAEEFPFPFTAPVNAAPIRPSHTTTTSRELEPFCGLHRVGGLSSQDSFDAPPSSAPAAFPAGHDTNISMPGLSMSQSTLLSTQSSTASIVAARQPNKRSYDEDAEDEMDAYFDEAEAQERVVPVKGRRSAKLRSSRHEQDISRVGMYVPGKVIEGEFEEAPFLVPMDTDV